MDVSPLLLVQTNFRRLVLQSSEHKSKILDYIEQHIILFLILKLNLILKILNHGPRS